MCNFKKIELVHISALISIWLDIFVSILFSSFIFFTEINIYISIFLFLFLIFVISCLLAFLGFKFFNYLLNKIKYSNPTISIEFKLSIPSLPYLVIDDNIKAYYWIKRHLNTITIYNFNTLDIKKSRQVIRNNISIDNEKYAKKRHWQFDINILICSYQKYKNDLILLISSINNFQLYEIGKFSIGYIDETKTLIIRTFTANQINFLSFFRYKKSLKYICKYLNLPFNEIIRSL